MLLIATEWLGLGHSSFGQANTRELFPFLLRLLLFLSIFLVTDLYYTRILFLLIVLYSYLALGQWFSYGIALIGIVALVSLSFADPVLMGLVPSPELALQQEGLVPAPPSPVGPAQQPPPLRPPPPPRPTLGSLIDSGMGAVITLFFTLLLASAMAQALQQQQELEALNSSLEASHTQLKQYASQVAELATTEERNRLARDIHDSLGHHLAAINIQLEKASAYRERDSARADEAVGHAKRSVQDALKDVRESVSSLREEGETFSLDESLDALVKRMSHSKLAIRLTQTGDSKAYGKLALMTLYRVVQEALTNVHKHAQASRVDIDIEFSNEQAHLTVTDNGEGFDVATWQDDESSYGLRGLQERLSLVGGTLQVHSKSGQTSLDVMLPNHTYG